MPYDDDFTADIEMQQVWRTVSQSDNSGIFIWDVVQVVGTPFDEKHFLMCNDGTWIMIYCYHFWTIESAGKHLHDVFDKYQVLQIIQDPEPTYKSDDDRAYFGHNVD